MSQVKGELLILRLQPYLDLMLNQRESLQETKWMVTENANTVSRNIRRAIELAASTIKYKMYANLLHDYKLCVEGHYVIARPRRKPEPEIPKVQLYKLIYENHAPLANIIGYIALSKAQEIYFPKAELTLEDKNRLYKYCQLHSLFIIDQEEAGLTITNSDPDNISWKPPE